MAELICPVCDNVVDASDAECGRCRSNIVGLASARPTAAALPGDTTVVGGSVPAVPDSRATECPAGNQVLCPDARCRAPQSDPNALACEYCERPLSDSPSVKAPELLLPWGTRGLADGECLALGRDVGPFAAELDEIPTVSRDHASIVRRGCELVLVDHGSTNGTYVGDTRLPDGIERPLRFGEVVRLSQAFKIHVVPAP